MKRMSIDGNQLTKAIAQLTNHDIEPSDWPWVVMFDADLEHPIAQVHLPARTKSPVGLHMMDNDVDRQSMDGRGWPELTIVNPFKFVDLDEDFAWEGELPELTERDRWERGKLVDLLETIRQSLRDEVEIEGETYHMTYH